MPQTKQEKEAANMARLQQEFPNLKDTKHRSDFHRYLAKTFIKDVDKPEEYDDLKSAYQAFKES